METRKSGAQINPTSDIFNQRELNLCYIRKLRKMISGDPSLAHAAFRQLKKNQKRCLLIASGLDPHLTDWKSLTPYQIKKIRVGIKRLKQLINIFSTCNGIDFNVSYPLTQKREPEAVQAKTFIYQSVQDIKKQSESV